MKETPVSIIAEIGVNHNGSIDLAKEMIDAATEAGADVVKFQTFVAEKVISNKAQKADYQRVNTGDGGSQLEMVKRLELSFNAYMELKKYCDKRQIEFMSTPFDDASVDLLANELNVRKIKVPSGEITNAPLLLKMARTGRPLIVSTGMATLGEIEMALGVLCFGMMHNEKDPESLRDFHQAYCSDIGQRLIGDRITLLHCTTEYPAPFQDVNLRVLRTLREAFQLPVGYSDHTVGISIPIAAVSLGACIIEKHFTLDRTLPGPDHRASIEPDELSLMVKSIREVSQALGHPRKLPAESERKNIDIARRSLVAARDLKEGEIFTPEALDVKRPGTGLSPFRYWEILGQKSNRAYQPDDIIEP